MYIIERFLRSIVPAVFGETPTALFAYISNTCNCSIKKLKYFSASFGEVAIILDNCSDVNSVIALMQKDVVEIFFVPLSTPSFLMFFFEFLLRCFVEGFHLYFCVIRVLSLATLELLSIDCLSLRKE